MNLDKLKKSLKREFTGNSLVVYVIIFSWILLAILAGAGGGEY